MTVRSKTPSVQSHPAAPPVHMSQTPGLQFTPMEGVPERCYPRAQTAQRLALLAQYPAQRQEETLVIRKANDDILLPEPAVNQEGEAEEGDASASSSGVSCHPMVTPYGRHREIDIQVGNSLGKERVSRPLVNAVTVPILSRGAALDSLKTPAPPKDNAITQMDPQPIEYAGNDDDDNNDIPGCYDDGPGSEGDHDDHEAAEGMMHLNEPQLMLGPGPSSTAAPAPENAARPSIKSRGRPSGASKRPREMLCKETEADRRARKSLAGDGLVVDESNGTRRSSRAHQRPLEYWRNEHKVFGRDHQTLPTVTRYETRTPNPSWPLSNKGKDGKKRARTRG